MTTTTSSVAKAVQFVDMTLAFFGTHGRSEWQRLEAVRDAAYRRLHAARDDQNSTDAFVYAAAIRECDARIFAIWQDAS